jgi:DNA-binding CsgD family transcriptional regulator/PAS domain-containing protein
MVDVSKIIDDLYQGTLDPLAWGRAMVGIADAVRASGAMLFAFDPGSGAILLDENHRVDPLAVENYRRYWTFEDFRLRYVLDLPTGQPATEATLGIPLEGSRLYHEYLLAVDMPHFLPVWLYKSKDKVVGLSLQGSRKRGAFGEADLEIVRGILPHFARAFEIRDRLQAMQVRAANFANLLDSVAFGVVVLSERNKILEANSVATSIFRDGVGIHRGEDGTLTITHACRERLSRMTSASSPADALMHIPRDGKLPLSLLVLPAVAESGISWISAEPRRVLLIFDPERKAIANEAVIMRDLGLSEREAKVATLLSAGIPVDRIAKRLRVSVHTVRSQLKSAFHKAGCHTQAQLVRKVLLGPACRPDSHPRAAQSFRPNG